MPSTRPPSSPRARSSKGRTAPPTPTVIRRMEVRNPLKASQVNLSARSSREREQHCLEIANYIADLAGETIVKNYFDSIAADYTASSLWDSMMGTLVTSCQDHDRPAHPSDVYEGIPVKRPGAAPKSLPRSAVDASLPLAPSTRKGRTPSIGRHAQIALVGGSGGQGVDVVLEVVNSATNWSGPDTLFQVGSEPASPDRGDFAGMSPAMSGEGGRWRTDAAPNRIPCDEHSRYVAGIINKSRALSPGNPSSSPPRRRAMTTRGMSVSQVVDTTLGASRLQVTTPRVPSAKATASEPTGAVTRSASRRSAAKSETPIPTPRPTSQYKRNRPETAKEAADRAMKEDVEAETERLAAERELEDNLPPDVDLDCHRQLTERLRKERVAKEVHDKRLKAVVAGMSALQTSRQPFIVDGSKGLVVGIQPVGDTMQRALQNSPRFSVERRGEPTEVATPAPVTRPATSNGWSTRGATPRTATKRKPKSAEDKLKDFVEPQQFKPMEISVEPAGGVTHVDGGGTVKKAEMRLPPGKLNQEEYAKLVARGGGGSTNGGWFADNDGKIPEAAKVPATPTLPHSSPRKPQSAQSARSFRR